MKQERASKATVAILGTGKIGQVVAANLVKGNRPVILADRDLSKAKALAAKLGNLVQPMAIAAAIREADIIVFAVWYDAIKELLASHAADLAGKIIVDPSNPIAPDGKGGFVKTIGEKDSAGKLLSALSPRSAKFVKAFGTLSAGSLAGAAHQKPEPAVLFYATDDTSVDAAIEGLIRDSGFAPQRVGGIEQSIRIEVFGDLHEFGALGKTVTPAEAKEKL